MVTLAGVGTAVGLPVKTAWAAPWESVTSQTIGTVEDWSNKVELADIDGDGRLDILFANGGSYASPGTPTLNRVFRNPGGLDQPWEDVTTETFGDGTGLTRALKVADLNGDLVESDEANNLAASASFPVAVTPAADLSVTEVVVSSSGATFGSTVDLTFRVNNDRSETHA